MTYRKKSHFKEIAPVNASITRLSANACEFETETTRGIIYECTIVASLDFETRDITLNSDGRATMTTKKWINEFIGRYNHRVFQKNYERFVELFDGKVIDYKDNMVL